MATCPTPPEVPVTSTRSPRASRPCTNSACQAVSPPIGSAAASAWLSREGFGASTSAGTTEYSAATPSRSNGVSAYTSSPLPTTTPESSYEGIAGSRSTGHSSSPRVIAAACTRTSTSPGPGDGVSISSTFKPSSCSRTASTSLPRCPLDFVLQEILPSPHLPARRRRLAPARPFRARLDSERQDDRAIRSCDHLAQRLRRLFERTDGRDRHAKGAVRQKLREG